MIRDFFIYDKTQNVISIQLKHANNSPVDLSNTDLTLNGSRNPYINVDFSINSNSEIAIVNASTGNIEITFTPNLNMGSNDTDMQYQLIGTIDSVTYTYMAGRFYVTNSIQ